MVLTTSTSICWAQIPHLPHVDPIVKRTARQAAVVMDRPPISELIGWWVERDLKSSIRVSRGWLRSCWWCVERSGCHRERFAWRSVQTMCHVSSSYHMVAGHYYVGSRGRRRWLVWESMVSPKCDYNVGHVWERKITCYNPMFEYMWMCKATFLSLLKQSVACYGLYKAMHIGNKTITSTRNCTFCTFCTKRCGQF